MIPWYDRKSYKEKIQRCFNDNNKLSFICVDDNEEIWHIAEWIRESMQKKKTTVAEAVHSSKADTLMCELLDQVIYDLDSRYKFQNYKSMVEELFNSKDATLTINQNIGNNTSAGNKMDYNGVNQTVITDELYKKNSLAFKKERVIELLIDKFIIDIEEVIKKEKSLFLLFIFSEGGLGVFESKRQNRFLHCLCKRMRYIDGIEVCVLNETNYKGFIQLGKNPIVIPARLENSDMLQAAKEHLKGSDPFLFCRDAITDNKEITYFDFARRLSAAI
ncbi:MAG: hypothetical protein HQL61_00795 [Magnetococcales bacterium]|uniref:Uncharacterized protein n=1 Tax=Candidatus Magnetobacterium casense TaxID=1455061 RepID=A0ABS6RWT6_9BACT|nr:hypothetical protein [Candidatus Magnetobacterium casensis]MBF0606072.1 hypothetical protein [Nitrospirota bacterium]MBV6340810.1 hypothetical protein [Candidatus Magnetobacterium casensis]